MRNKFVPAFLISFFSINLFSAQPNMDFMINMMKQEKGFGEAAKCLNISDKQLEDAMRKTIKYCMAKFNFSESAKLDTCFKSQSAANLGKSKAEIDACESDEVKSDRELTEVERQLEQTEQQVAVLYQKNNLSALEQRRLKELSLLIENLSKKQIQLSNKVSMTGASEPEMLMEQLFDEIGDNEPTPQQLAKMQQLRSQLMQANVGQFKAQPDTVRAEVAETSQATLGEITLPIYKNSQVMMHLTLGVDLSSFGVSGQSLPGATFSSSDKAGKIVQFYQQQLPSFSYKKLATGEHLLMEKMPEDFDLLKDLQVYSATPHVLIKSIERGSGSSADSQSIIEISYRR